MRVETILDDLDAAADNGGRSGKLPLPGLSAEDIAALRSCGNPVAALAGETTDKAYFQLQRFRNVISNSILGGLHACPRRLLLEKIEANKAAHLQLPESPNIDFVFGHSVGAGVQALFAFERLDYALYAAFLSWRAGWDFGREDYLRRKNKTIEKAVLAVESFSYFRNSNLDEWEIYTTATGKPAVEISFCIDLGKTKYYGHIDLILRNKRTGRIAVGEIKTSGYSNPDEASYRNSGQALGYSLILDSIVGVDADYDVIYMTYSSTGQEWHLMPFAKSTHMKLEWLQDRLIDSGHLQQYFQLQHFPKNGASCLQFNRRCQFYGTCDLVNKEALNALPIMDDPRKEYLVDYYYDVAELIERQKGTAP